VNHNIHRFRSATFPTLEYPGPTTGLQNTRRANEAATPSPPPWRGCMRVHVAPRIFPVFRSPPLAASLHSRRLRLSAAPLPLPLRPLCSAKAPGPCPPPLPQDQRVARDSPRTQPAIISGCQFYLLPFQYTRSCPLKHATASFFSCLRAARLRGSRSRAQSSSSHGFHHQQRAPWRRRCRSPARMRRSVTRSLLESHFTAGTPLPRGPPPRP